VADKLDAETAREQARTDRTYIPAPAGIIDPGAGLNGLIGTLSPEEQALFAEQRANAEANKAKKSGTYTSTEQSSTTPTDAKITEDINKLFRQYYGRDARPNELEPYLAEARTTYVDPKTGATKSFVQEVYKDGNLVSRKVLTADKQDPLLQIEASIKKNIASGLVDVNKANIPEGPSGKYFTALKDLARRNGLNLSDNAAADYANKIQSEQIDENTAYNLIRESAASAFPQFAENIKAGVDLKTIADPYIQSMSNILEIPDTGIDLFDPTVRGALSYTQPDGKVGTKSLYTFETELKNDPRWAYTQNARKSLDNVGLQILKSWGLAS
jgi:hypothetical protein